MIFLLPIFFLLFSTQAEFCLQNVPNQTESASISTNNGASGVQFDVTAKTNCIIVERLWTTVTCTGNASIFMNPNLGGVASTSGVSGFQRIATATIFNASSNTLVQIPTWLNVTIKQGETRSFAIVKTCMRYQNTVGLDTIISEDDFIRVRGGRGLSDSFQASSSVLGSGSIFNNREARLRVEYSSGILKTNNPTGSPSAAPTFPTSVPTMVPSNVPTVSPTNGPSMTPTKAPTPYATAIIDSHETCGVLTPNQTESAFNTNNNAAGAQFDVTSKTSCILIRRFWTKTICHNRSVAVFMNPNLGAVGSASDVTGFERIANVTVETGSSSVFTMIPITVNITLKANETRSFAIVTDNTCFRYENVGTTSTVLAEDDFVRVQGGRGLQSTHQASQLVLGSGGVFNNRGVRIRVEYSSGIVLTKNPTGVPTFGPTSIPSAAPSSVPTAGPTNGPSSTPTFGPTGTPSNAPSSHPTFSPSSVPSNTPSSIPSAGPTSMPTSIPSKSPSSVPSTIPSVNPSFAPTTNPTSVPSVNPTSIPSGHPTFAPTNNPSSIPTASPSMAPTDTPTSVPTNVPSDAPSSIPSQSPSLSPSSAPSQIPSDSPTSVPSFAPSSAPSSIPSQAPSNSPSAVPSAFPTQSPTSGPTRQWFINQTRSFRLNVNVTSDVVSPSELIANTTRQNEVKTAMYEAAQDTMRNQSMTIPTLNDVRFGIDFVNGRNISRRRLAGRYAMNMTIRVTAVQAIWAERLRNSSEAMVSRFIVNLQIVWNDSSLSAFTTGKTIITLDMPISIQTQPPEQEDALLGPIILIIISTSLAILFTTFNFIFFGVTKRPDFQKNELITWIFLIFNTYTHIAFTWFLESFDTTLFVFSLLFLIVPFVASLIGFYRFASNMKKEAAFQRYMETNKCWFGVISILCGSIFNAFYLANSNAFENDVFAMNEMKFVSQRVWYAVVFEDLGMFGVWIGYLVSGGTWNGVVVCVLIGFIASVVIEIVNYVNGREEKKEDTHESTKTSLGQGQVNIQRQNSEDPSNGDEEEMTAVSSTQKSEAEMADFQRMKDDAVRTI